MRNTEYISVQRLQQREDPSSRHWFVEPRLSFISRSFHPPIAAFARIKSLNTSQNMKLTTILVAAAAVGSAFAFPQYTKRQKTQGSQTNYEAPGPNDGLSVLY